MKKAVTILSAILLTAQFAFAQQQNLPKLSPLTRIYLDKIKKYTGDGYQRGYVYKTIANKLYLSSIIMVRDSKVETSIKQLGGLIGTKAGNIWTVKVPVEKAVQFTQLPGIEYIQFDEPALPNLDSARRATHVDSVHAPIGIWMPYTGKDVIVGIVDIGFDYGHPIFFDTTGSNYRVKKVWEQKTTGTPPAGFAYGNEMTDSVTMWSKGTDNATQTHGTHVAGIAAGSGFGSSADNRRFRGMAFNSDVVLVGINPPQSQWIATGSSDMLDGINYIFQYAASVNKPAVVNLSWGGPLGPRDGTSLFNQALDNLTGPGKIFVCSAGNNGGDQIHVQKQFSATDSVVSTFINITNTPNGKKTWVDLWGDAGKTFCVKIALYNSGTQLTNTGYICLDNTIHHTYLIGSNNDTCFIDLTTSSAEFNGKPRVFMEFNSKVSDDVCITLKGTDGTVNMWDSYVYNATGYYSTFQSNGQSWATSGDINMTISDLAVAKSCIPVGAYASKVAFTNISGNSFSYNGYAVLGNLVPFSSRGPSVDGRSMPFITGPGLTLGSSVSSFDTSFYPAGSSYSYVVKTYHHPANGKDYAYAMLSGTSMSSPCVAGIVAMMLEANHSLDPKGVKNILMETAIKDIHTGALTQPDNNWGYGKVNAYRAVLRAFQTSGVSMVANPDKNCTLFPNPSNGRFIIDYTAQTSQTLAVNVYDVKGSLVASEIWPVQKGENAKNFDFSSLQKGIYFTKLSAAEGTTAVKTLFQ